MPVFQHDGIDFYYRKKGKGKPFIFQHGLGGDTAHPFGVFHPPEGFQMLTLDMRGHGRSFPVGPDGKISLPTFADDIIAWMDHLEMATAVIGGISMGAGIALNLALRYPERFEGVVLSRPAWMDRPDPKNLTIYATIAALIRTYGAEKGLGEFKKTEDYKVTQAHSPDSAVTLCKQFLSLRAEDAVARLERIPHNQCHIPMNEWSKIKVPALVLAGKQDTIHRFEYGQAWADAIGSAEFRELTPKSVSPEQHIADLQHAIERFLTTHFLQEA